MAIRIVCANIASPADIARSIAMATHRDALPSRVKTGCDSHLRVAFGCVQIAPARASHVGKHATSGLGRPGG
eukprot:5378282-Pyramimonas_sp.AAC.1